jgi:hypothetical protein
VNEMWEAGAPVIAVGGSTPKGRKRRIMQLAWSTHLREYRKRPCGVVAEESSESDDGTTMPERSDSAPTKRAKKFLPKQNRKHFIPKTSRV